MNFTLDQLATIPQEFKNSSRWLLWRLEDSEERERCKVPKTVTGKNASPTNPDTWCSLEEAIKAFPKVQPFEKYASEENNLGVGLVIGAPYVGVDLDKCLDPGTGVLEEWAQQIIEDFPKTYTEISPSGRGVHLWYRCDEHQKLEDGKRTQKAEVYARKRYFTMTGQRFGDAPSELATLPLAKAQSIYRGIDSLREKSAAEVIPLRTDKSIEEIIQRDPKEFPDLSAAVQSLLGRLAYSTVCDQKVMEGVFKRSRLYRETHWREKWERLRESELDKACELVRPRLRKKLARVSQDVVPHPPLVISDSKRLLTRTFKNREPLMVTRSGCPVFHTGSINQIHAWRGVGKTNLAFGIGKALAEATRFLAWDATRSFRVLYVEGELPGQEMQERVRGLVGEQDNFMVITPEDQPDSTIPSIAEAEGRRLIEEAIVNSGAEVLFLDSISTLANIPTNEEEEWLELMAWLKYLRNKYGTAIFYLQHDGKAGAQRGHSKSEDILDKSIQLTWESGYRGTDGLKFELKFDKARQPVRESSDLLVELAEKDGKLIWVSEEVGQKVKEQALEAIARGENRRDIAKRLSVSSKTLTKWKQEARPDALPEKEELF